MTSPRKHHYLPEWYLSRWKRAWGSEEVIWEFGRVGPERLLHSRYRHPAATGYAIDLYTIPDAPPSQAARIETEFLQVIDDRGAKAVSMAERNEIASVQDKGALVQFLLSMLHRSPDRIAYLEGRLADDLSSNPLFEGQQSSYFRAAALDVFTDLVQSQVMIDRMMQLSAFVITLHQSAHDLLTSDNPLMISNGMAHRDAFVMLPIDPRKILILAENVDIPKHMAGHDGKTLAKAINDAVVVQAKKLVFGADRRQLRFIDNRLSRPNHHLARAIDPIMGLVKWKI
ncbi:DUF4238 domain-containing protein [Erythrobacter donghaensis]|uniref:DUF4238 domain-containing protein n=1 Tax=Erythrobacter donghaensis TaxID=267135 RepID=UPI000A3B26BA|nr:DUF4238 domain-containing protein [Erythrobacter donghaensis]